MTTSSQTTATKRAAASSKPAADFLAAAKHALESGADPALVATYLGHAAEAPTAGTLRLLASLLADTVKRARNGNGR